MKKIIYLSITLVCIFFSVRAQVPQTLTYQGFLTDASGNPEQNPVNLVFKIYDGPSSVYTATLNSVPISKGLFNVVLGKNEAGNPVIPSNIWSKPLKVGIAVNGAAELPQIDLTVVPYAFMAANVDNIHVQDLADGTLSGSKVGTGVDATHITTGLISNAVLDDDLDDLVDGSLSGSKVGTGISATNVTTGTLTNAVLDVDLQDLADGSLSGTVIGTGISASNVTTGTLSGSLVGTGISATNITTGAISNAVLDDDLDDLVDGSLTGSKVGTGISASNITTGTLTGSLVGTGIDATNITTGTISNAVLDDDLDDLVDGSLSGSKIGTGISATNVTAGTLPNAVLDAELQDLADGSLSGSVIGTGISASNVTAGTLPNSVLDADLQDLADGSLSNSVLDADLQDLAADGILTNLNVSGSASITTSLAGIAIGNNNSAEGDHSLALGSYARLSPTGDGSVFLGDRSVAVQTSGTAINRFYARFDNGYFFYTNAALTANVFVGNGGTSWTTVSDSTKKENFRPVNGESILAKIGGMKLGTWNYKFNSTSIRHYGPYAQDFFNLFGKDEIGYISADTAIVSQDISGLNMTAIQALVKRTDAMQLKLSELETELQVKNEEMVLLKKFIERQYAVDLSNQEKRTKNKTKRKQKTEPAYTYLKQ